MQIHETFTVDAPRARVVDHLLDIPRMASCVPGVGDVHQADDGSYEATLSVQLGPIRSRFAGSLSIDASQTPDRLRATGRGRDRSNASQASVDMVAELVEADEESTEVRVTADVSIRGRLGQFGTGVINSTAAEMTQQFARCLQAQISADRSPDTAEAVRPSPDETDSPTTPSLLTILATALRRYLVERWGQIRNRMRKR